MARKVKTEKEVKKNKKKKFLIIFIVLIVIILAGVLVWKFAFANNEPKTAVEIKELDNLVEYKYTLTDKDSKYFKSEFEVLKDILNSKSIDEEKYATQVARMFTIDLYTLSTKVNKYDVGGIEYYHVTKKDMFSKKVIDTLYSSLLDDTYGDRDQDLPEIKSVETVSTEKTTYKLGEEEVPAYLVKLNLTYEEELGYDNSASVIVCKEDSVRLSVVDFQPTLNPTYK